LRSPPSRDATRAYAEGFDWEATTRGQIDLFRAISGHGAETPGTGGSI
jgi:hypothetical protein